MSKPNFFDQYDDAPTAAAAPVASNYFDQFDPVAPEVDTMEVVGTPVADSLESAASLPGRVESAVTEGVENYTTKVNGIEGSENPVSAAANIVRPGLHALDAVMDTGVEVWQATWGQHPLFDNDLVKAGLEGIGNSSIAKYAMNTLETGYEAYLEFAEANPTEAAALEDAGVVAEVFTPKVKLPNAAKSKLHKVGGKFKRKGVKQDLTEQKEDVAKMLRPDSMVGEGETIEVSTKVPGVRKTQYIPSGREDSIIEAVNLVDDVDVNRSYTYNNMKIRQESRKLHKDLNKVLMKHGNPSINKPQLIDNLKLAVDDVTQIPGYHSLSGDAQKYALEYYDEVIGLINKSKGTRATQILKVRQEFDRHVNAGSKVYDPHRESAKQVAARHIRDVLNQSVKDVDPSGDVHDLLSRQHNLLSGSDILRDKVAKEANNTFLRIGHKMRELAHLPTTPLALYATTVPLVTTALGPVAGGAALGGLGIYHTYKAMTSAQRKKELGRLIQHLSKPSYAKEFATERVFLTELLKAEMAEDVEPE